MTLMFEIAQASFCSYLSDVSNFLRQFRKQLEADIATQKQEDYKESAPAIEKIEVLRFPF
jgi:hypothetical protein